MGRAAGAWLAALDQRQQRDAQLDWTSRLRESWHYVPRARPGIALKAMNAAQTAAAWDLLGSLLSARGLDQVRGQLTIERILGELSGSPGFRDPGNYALVVFGDPAGSAPWAWRFEGHHLSLSVLVAPDHGVAVTPAFFGANPAHVPRGHAHGGFRLVGAEEDAAFSLIQSLEGGLRTQAVIADRSLGDIVSGPGRELDLKRFEGVPLARLNGRNAATSCASSALRRHHARGDRRARARQGARGRPEAAFRLGRQPGAWTATCFRVHGPTALVEYDHPGRRQPRAPVDRPAKPFGRDLLKAHYKGALRGRRGRP
jgi:hypothetical protein